MKDDVIEELHTLITQTLHSNLSGTAADAVAYAHLAARYHPRPRPRPTPAEDTDELI